jgi:hypothetical protein
MKVIKSAEIAAGKMLIDEKLDFQFDAEAGAAAFFKAAYTHYEPAYLRFFKMDELSKLAFLATHLLLQGQELACAAEEKAIVLFNRSSSLETDMKYQQSIADRNSYFPSPSVFVYTLPNITIGELCIHFGIKGENYFLIDDNEEPFLFKSYIDQMFEEDRCKYCIAGRVEYFEEKYRAKLYLIEQNDIKTVNSAVDFSTFEF